MTSFESPLRSVVHGLLIRPAGRGDAPAEISELRFRNIDAEGANGITGRRGDFTVALEDGARLHARRLVVASGLVDVLPDIDGIVDRLRSHGAQPVGEVVEYGDQYRLCYVRGPEGIVVALAEQR